MKNEFFNKLLADDPGWLALLELRNLTRHTYDEKIAEQIYAQPPGVVRRFQELLTGLQRG